MDTKKICPWPALLLIVATLNISVVCSYGAPWLVILTVVGLHVSFTRAANDTRDSEQTDPAKIEEKYSWSFLDWAYAGEWRRITAILSDDYVPSSGVPTGIAIWKNKLFITVPRWTSGIPATLNYIDLETAEKPSPPLIPYPSWEKNAAGVCGENIITVHRIRVDKCDRLWVLDFGSQVRDDSVHRVCPPVLHVIDLNKNEFVRQHILPQNILPQFTFRANVVVDTESDDCDNAFAYISDEQGVGLTVYDWAKNTSWHRDFIYTSEMDYQISTLGVYGMALSPVNKDGHKVLHFHRFNANQEFGISTSILKDEKRMDGYLDLRQTPLTIFPGQATSEVIDENGVMLFTMNDNNAIGCWNTSLPHPSENHTVIAKDDKDLIYPDDIVIGNGFAWILSNRLPFFAASLLNDTDINFRISTIKYPQALEGTLCEVN